MARADERLRRAARLRGREAFRGVYEQGSAYRGALLVMLVHFAPGTERKVGFVTSRRVGTAVSRNHARRLLRESYRRLQGDLGRRGRHAHYVFIARAALPRATFSDVVGEMRTLMERAGVMDAGVGRDRE